MKYVSIRSVTLKSAITPSFMGLMATTLPGVRPSMSLASRPTATTSPFVLLMATMEGSFTTMPLPLAYTSVLAVPRSIAKSDENKLNTDRRLKPFFIPTYRKPFWLEFRFACPMSLDDDAHALDGRAAAAVLSHDDDFMAPAR